MKFIPHNYQERSHDYIINHDKCGLIVDMGLGKTVITLSAIQDLMYDYFSVQKVLVVAPLRVAQLTWSDEIEKWDHLNLTISKVLGSVVKRKEALKTKADIYIVNRENVVWLVDYIGKDFDFDMVVVDEWSSFKNSKSKRFRALKKVMPYVDRFVGLTGTPSPNGYLDLWGQMYLIDQGDRLYPTMTRYRDAFFSPGRRNGHIIFEWDLRDGAKERIQQKMGDVCISLQAKDWLEMPERIDRKIFVDLDEKVMADYKRFEAQSILEYEEDKALIGTHAGALTNKLLQYANGAVYNENREVVQIHDEKINALNELIEGANGKSVLVFYSYKHDLAKIMNHFPEARTLDGEKDFKNWNAGKTELLVCHPASMGHGLNMQDGGNIIVWFGLTWSLELYLQANARLYRQGQKQKVIVYHIMAKDTHDEDVMRSLENKKVNQNELIEAVKARIRK
ncbi:MAG: SNF2-related protein [Breznakia sp.]